MFKSSQHLREAAAQRQLDRVASSWRQARTTWFDGTPESIESRLSETNRLLTVARSGQTPAHIGLSVEAENARRELLAAKHRLLNDFLDDGARAFKGSKRVAFSDITMADAYDGEEGDEGWDDYVEQSSKVPPEFAWMKDNTTPGPNPYANPNHHGFGREHFPDFDDQLLFGNN